MREKLGGYDSVSHYLDAGTQSIICKALDMPDLDLLESDGAGGSESEPGLGIAEEAVESIEDHVGIAIESESELGHDESS